MVAAKLANLEHGQRADLNDARPANLPVFEQTQRAVSQPAAAELLNVSERSVRNAVRVKDQGCPIAG